MRGEHDKKESSKGPFDREYKNNLMIVFGLPKTRRHEIEQAFQEFEVSVC